MSKESYNSKATAIHRFRNLFRAKEERQGAYEFDLGHFRHDPLAAQLHESEIQPELNVALLEANQGDVFAFFDNRPHLAVATGQIIGNRHIFYRVHPKAERTAYLHQPRWSKGIRIARQITITIPELIPENPVSAVSTDAYLAKLPTSEELQNFRFHCSETHAFIYHRSTQVEKIQSPDEVQYDPVTGELAHEYLYVTKKGIPIFLSDYHQKLATHIAYLISAELLPNQRPLISWIDKHPDDIFNRNGLQRLPKKQFMLKGIDACVDQIDCGQAASFLLHTGLASIRSFGDLSSLAPPGNSLTYPALSHQQPFARPPHEQTQIVSFDLDQLPFFCDPEYNKYVGDYVGLDAETTKSYFKWLAEAGMNAENFDAVCAYTSPGYVEPWISIEGFKYLVELFE